jgi:site-specific DNA recombinase
MRIAACARYSSDNQREQSIDEQLRAIREWADKRGYTIVAEYCDKAISGASSNRPQFNQMLADSAKNLFDAVAVFDYTRFSRKGEEGLFDEWTLIKNGVALISITEDYGNSFGAKLIKHVKFLNAAEDLEKLRLNVERGQKENALAAMHNGGTPPLGYDVDKTTLKYEVNEREAEAIKMIFEMFAEGVSYNQISAKLNALGY